MERVYPGRMAALVVLQYYYLDRAQGPRLRGRPAELPQMAAGGRARAVQGAAAVCAGSDRGFFGRAHDARAHATPGRAGG